MNKLAKVLVRCVGVVGIVAAGFGIFYNFQTLTAVFGGRSAEIVKKHQLAYFYPAFFIMSAICIACYVMLLVCGVDLLRLRLRRAGLLTGVMIFEVVYFISIGMLWLMPGFGMSVAAATGIANGGLMVQFVIFFPLWAPMVVWWARTRQQTEVLAV
ncbi:MAG: hypothetical protein ABSH19_09195 [Opitutales bacterium]|jgi:hypothetical protein